MDLLLMTQRVTSVIEKSQPKARIYNICSTPFIILMVQPFKDENLHHTNGEP